MKIQHNEHTVNLQSSQHFTPSELLSELVSHGVGAHTSWPANSVVLDPACGDGRLLTAAKAKLVGARVHYIGFELDPDLVLQARANCPFADIRHCDGLLDDALSGAEPVQCVLMNPPFGGSATIGKMMPDGYRARLKKAWPDAKGKVDLSAFFLRRMSELVCKGGTISCIAPNTIAQGGSRRAALKPMLADGWEIYRATRSAPWPGRAAVCVSVVHLFNGEWLWQKTLT